METSEKNQMNAHKQTKCSQCKLKVLFDKLFKLPKKDVMLVISVNFVD